MSSKKNSFETGYHAASLSLSLSSYDKQFGYRNSTPRLRIIQTFAMIAHIFVLRPLSQVHGHKSRSRAREDVFNLFESRRTHGRLANYAPDCTCVPWCYYTSNMLRGCLYCLCYLYSCRRRHMRTIFNCVRSLICEDRNERRVYEKRIFLNSSVVSELIDLHTERNNRE